MAYDINSMLENNLKAILATSTAGLCASLTTNVTTITSDSIMIGDPKRLTRQVDQYPCIIITPKSKSQEWDELGINSANKMGRQVTIPVDILCLVQCASDSEDVDKQARTLARNVESILETNIERSDTTSTVSDGWHICKVNNAVYEGSYVENTQTYVSSVRLETEFKTFGYR